MRFWRSCLALKVWAIEASGALTGVGVLGVDLETHLLTSGDFDTNEEAPKYVRASELTDQAINILFYGRTNDGTYQGYLEVSERLNLRILSAVEAAGTNLAYPTQKIVTESDTI